MRADVWLELANNEIQKGNGSDAAAYCRNAMDACADHVSTAQRLELADNMITFDPLLSEGGERVEESISEALQMEVESGRVETGDMSDFVMHMDRFGMDEWAHK